MKKLLIITLIWVCFLASNGYGQSMTDSLTQREKRTLITEMASLIKEYAFFHGGTMVWRYDSWVDTTGNLRLYVAEQVAVLGDCTPPEWYYVDFTQPIKAGELRLTMGRNDNFMLESVKAITKKKTKKKERNRSLLIFFFTNKKKRTTDFGQLYTRLNSIISKLTLTESGDSQALK